MRRNHLSAFFCTLFVAWVLCMVPVFASARTCQDCHYGAMYTAGFDASVHAKNGCLSCHSDVTDLNAHMTGHLRPAPVTCGKCHAGIAEKYRKNFHYLQEDFRCVDCHRDVHTRTAATKDIKIRTIEVCTQCHGNDEYVTSGHAEAVLKGNHDAAACGDCHGLHDTRVFHTSLSTYPEEARMFYNDKCVSCHDDSAMMQRNNLSDKVVEYYEETYHGKVQGVGFATLVAGCADCHQTHNILPKTDPRSSIHPDNLVANCGRCHTGFHKRFVDYKAHPDYHDRHNYPALFWTFVFMSGLLIFTFVFFWSHTLLWWRKSYWEHHEREKSGILPETCMTDKEGFQHIQRFSRMDRAMHVLLILSFFTLVTTGFPLKYPKAAWAKLLMGFWGGAPMAGLFHRIAAVVLMVLFAVVAVRCLLFLFPPGVGVLTTEFKINLLAPAKGDRLIAEGRVKRAGKTLAVCLGEVFAETGGDRKSVALMTASMMVVSHMDIVD